MSTIIVGTIVLVAFIFAIKGSIKAKKNGGCSGCSGNCSACSTKEHSK
ncbi:MAG: FeoB-associated Cys-rich membrane protein [Anaerovoracaceae bacterium]